MTFLKHDMTDFERIFQADDSQIESYAEFLERTTTCVFIVQKTVKNVVSLSKGNLLKYRCQDTVLLERVFGDRPG